MSDLSDTLRLMADRAEASDRPTFGGCGDVKPVIRALLDDGYIIAVKRAIRDYEEEIQKRNTENDLREMLAELEQFGQCAEKLANVIKKSMQP